MVSLNNKPITLRISSSLCNSVNCKCRREIADGNTSEEVQLDIFTFCYYFHKKSILSSTNVNDKLNIYHNI